MKQKSVESGHEVVSGAILQGLKHLLQEEELCKGTGELFIRQKKMLIFLGHGDYSSANTKVLRMVNTTGVENEAKQIEALQNELQKTKEQLLAVQELKGQSVERANSNIRKAEGTQKHFDEQVHLTPECQQVDIFIRRMNSIPVIHSQFNCRIFQQENVVAKKQHMAVSSFPFSCAGNSNLD
ncbi:hypothetical protein HAX54_053054 [Datura stramonium]|uniref:Uncharacterized protein n=1 Tax=Datura stramonium TaxID=4076 RepID=A0ABS8SZT4_DATST|nr:hypothetical protein [Datura stramonium]